VKAEGRYGLEKRGWIVMAAGPLRLLNVPGGKKGNVWNLVWERGKGVDVTASKGDNGYI